MATARYLASINGVTQMVVPAVTSSGASTGGAIVALGSNGLLDPSVMPSGIGATTVTAVTSAAISAGQLVNFYSVSGTLTVRPADSTAAGSEANGFATAAVASGATGSFNVSGLVTGLSGLTIGATYFLGAVGGATAVAPSTAGNIIQPVGKAISATSLEFVQGTPITVA